MLMCIRKHEMDSQEDKSFIQANATVKRHYKIENFFNTNTYRNYLQIIGP